MKKNTETLANGYSYESTQQELSNEYQYDRVLDGFQKSCALDECSLSIGRDNFRDNAFSHNHRLTSYILFDAGPRVRGTDFKTPPLCVIDDLDVNLCAAWWLIWSIENDVKKTEK